MQFQSGKYRLLPVYSSVLLWHIGIALVMPFTSIWLRDEMGEASFLRLGIIIAVPNLIGIFGIFATGSYTDNKGHYREVLVLINVIGTAQFLLLTRITRPIQYLMIVGIGALLFPAYYTVLNSFTTQICEKNRRGTELGRLMLFASAGFFLGSLVSGRAFRIIGMEIMFVISAFLIFFAGLVVLLSPKSTHLENISGGNLSEDHPSILSIVKKKQILYILISIVILDTASGAFFTFGSIYLYERIKLTSDQIGYANALATLFGALILLKLGTYSDSKGRKPLYLFGLGIYPLFFVVISIFHQVTVVFLLWCIPLYAFLRPTLPAMISDLTNEVERSRGLSLMTVASTLSMTIGAIVGGYLADQSKLGMDVWTIIPAVIGWISLIFGYYFVNETIHENKKNNLSIGKNLHRNN